MSELNRRQLLIASAAAACAACLGGAESFAAENLAPVDIGTFATYPKDGIYDKFATSGRFLVVRNEGQLYAISNRCTHKAGVVRHVNGQLSCRNHGSEYSIHGTVTQGPATRSLTRHGISVTEKGRLIVDPGKSFEEREWDSEGTFLIIPKPDRQ
jgi:nitrite reductase/ring-hydroxylating ferredoxin subunit